MTVLYPTDWTDYELIDSGGVMKLERFGKYTIARTDPRAIWKPRTQNWISDKLPESWKITYNNLPAGKAGLTFVLKPTQFKHVGIFPEQATNWNWLQSQIHGDKIKVLNLFAYTGGATLAAAAAGAAVTHVDSVKSAIDWANENVAASNLKDKPIRWIEEDVMKFVIRESKRGNTYDGIILDPPRFGRGSKGEVWKIEEDLPRLLAEIKKILAPQPRFVLLNAYTADLSPLVLHHVLSDITNGGNITFGELALQESVDKRLLPSGIFARWANE
jgi:23S rRNA (cytosine1962-C5)-methyltransferase